MVAAAAHTHTCTSVQLYEIKTIDFMAFGYTFVQVNRFFWSVFLKEMDHMVDKLTFDSG